MQIDRLSSQTSRPQPEIIEKLTAEANAIERDLLSSSKEFGDYTRALAITYEDVQNSLGQNDIAIEFAAFILNQTLYFIVPMSLINSINPVWSY